MRRLLEKAAVAMLCLLLVPACVTDPVRERLELEMLPKERARVTAHVEIARVDRSRSSEAAARADRVRAEILGEADPWARRFEIVPKLEERRTWVKEENEVVAMTHTALVRRDDLNAFFGDTPVSIFSSVQSGVHELLIYPGSGSRADRQQQRDFERGLERWVEAGAAYYRALAALYDYLDLNPDRAEAIGAELFGEPLTESPALSGIEVELIEALDGALERAGNIVSLGNDAMFSMQYLSRLVYDTFPAEVEIVVPGEVVGNENLVRLEANRYAIPTTGLAEALGSLEGKWIEPDLLAMFLKDLTSRAEDESSLAEETVSLQSRVVHGIPDAESLRDALVEQLQRPRLYRLQWRE